MQAPSPSVAQEPPASEAEIPLYVLSDDSEDSTNEISKRAKKLFADLNPEEEQMMVEWLERNPVIYNKKLTAYKDIGKKERLWREIAVGMQKPVKLLKIWYTSVRSRYGRLKKKSGHFSKDLTEREQWILRNFDFLRPFIYEVKRRTGGNIKKLASTPNATHDPEVKVEPLLGTQSRIGTSEPPRPTSPAPEAKPLLQPQPPVLERLEVSTDREREAFLAWARSVVQQLECSLWRRCQRDMSEILCRYIAENDFLRRQPVPPCSAMPGPSEPPVEVKPFSIWPQDGCC